MQHVNRVSEIHNVDQAVGATLEVFTQFKYSGPKLPKRSAIERGLAAELAADDTSKEALAGPGRAEISSLLLPTQTMDLIGRLYGKNPIYYIAIDRYPIPTDSKRRPRILRPAPIGRACLNGVKTLISRAEEAYSSSLPASTGSRAAMA